MFKIVKLKHIKSHLYIKKSKMKNKKKKKKKEKGEMTIK